MDENEKMILNFKKKSAKIIQFRNESKGKNRTEFVSFSHLGKKSLKTLITC
jgi:hypothetical protein